MLPDRTGICVCLLLISRVAVRLASDILPSCAFILFVPSISNRGAVSSPPESSRCTAPKSIPHRLPRQLAEGGKRHLLCLILEAGQGLLRPLSVHDIEHRRRHGAASQSRP